MFKRYVDVVVYHDKRGEIQPLFMKWENKTYKIEKTECMGMSITKMFLIFINI